MLDNHKKLLIKYQKGIYDFENDYIKDIFINYKKYDTHRGYLINLESYNAIKIQVGSYFKDFKNASKIVNNLNALEEIEYKTSTYLLNMLFNGNKYIIVNSKIWELFGDQERKNEAIIHYSVIKDNIIFSPDDNIELVFSCISHNNIIDKSSFQPQYNKLYNQFLSNYENIKKIYDEIADYYKFENELELYLNNNQQIQKKKKLGYFVEINWLKKWKKKTNYEEIKKLIMANIDKSQIKNEIISLEEINRIKKVSLPKIEIKNFDSIEKLKDYSLKNSLALVNYYFIYHFDKNSDGFFQYYPSKNKIKISISSKELNFQTKNNIITLSQNNIEFENDKPDQVNILLKSLIEMYYFNEGIQIDMHSKYNSQIHDKNQVIYFMDKNSINNFKDFFEYSTVVKILLSNDLNLINCNNYKNYYKFIIDFIQSSNKEYCSKMIKKLSLNEFKFEKEKYKIPYELYITEFQQTKYFYDFEILNDEIISNFEKLGIVKKEYLTKGEYLACDEKIFLYFNEGNKKYIQIDYFDAKSQTYIIEYVIEDLTKFGMIHSLFRRNGINFFLNRRNNNKIIFCDEIICNCYEIKKNESIIDKELKNNFPNDTQPNNENNKDLYDIIELLFSYSLFSRDIKNKISENSSSQIYTYYLINKKIISEFLGSFWDDNINKIIEKYTILKSSDIDVINKLKSIIEDKDMEKCIKKINENKDLLKEKIKNIDLYKIEATSIKENNDIFYYPKDLMFLDESLLLKFITIFGIKDDSTSKKKAEILLNFNYGNIAFKNNTYIFLNNMHYLVYIYSLDKGAFRDLNFNIDFILSFNYSFDLNNHFKDITCLDIKNNCMELSKDFEKQYSLKIHLLNNKPNDNKENKLDKILIDLIDLYKEYQNMESKISSSAYSSSFSFEKEKKYYLINKKYIEDFEELLSFNKIKSILKNDINYSTGRNQKENLDKIKIFLSSEIKNKLMEIEDNSSLDKLKNYEFYKLQKIDLGKINFYYFENFVIINEKIKQILNIYNNSVDNFIKSVECCFDTKKFFISFEDNISVGHIEQNNQFITDNLIVPKYSSDKKYIFETINKEGYFFISKFLKSGKIEFRYEYKYNYTTTFIDIKADIYNIDQKSSININNSFNDSMINEKMKKLILLYLEIENNNLIYSKNKLEEEVHLINNNILSNPFIQELDLLIKYNREISTLLIKYHFAEKCLTSNQLEEIITKINKEKLNQLDKKSYEIKFQNINPNKKEAILKNGEKINIYEKFVMVRKQTFDKIYIDLNLFNAPKIFYSNLNEDDIIVDEKRENILIGKIFNNNDFNVNYILSFKYQIEISTELSFIKNYGIEQYLKSKAVFNNDLNDDYISPIFTKYESLGYVYKVINGQLDFSNVKNYAKFIQSSNFKKTIDLINYYNKFKEAMDSTTATESEYYLINQKTMSDIKKLYYYKDIKATMDKINQIDENPTNQSRRLLYILKFLPPKVMKNFIEEELDIEKMEKSLIEPNIEPIYPNNIINNNETPLGMIYKNFEIIEPFLVKQFCHGIRIDNNYRLLSGYEKDNNLLKCVLKDGKVIIKYENNMFGNQKNYLVIGAINNENKFINQYFLIYNKNYTSEVYNFKIRDLNNYLNKFQFFNNSCPIVLNEYDEIGTIINLGNSSNNINITTNDNQIQNVPITYDNNINNVNKLTNENNNFYGKYDNINNNNYKNQDEYNLDSINNITSIKQYFPYPPLIGLDNIGATCYMNATLQCLCNIEKFVDYFKYNTHLIKTVKNDIKKEKLCSSFKLLIEKLWPDNYEEQSTKRKKSISHNFSNQFEIQGFNGTNKSFPPEEFKKKISKMNSLFEGVAANDAKDLVQFLIMTLHTELNKAKENAINNAAINDQRNKQQMFQIFAQDFMNNNVSMISDLFYGVNYNMIQCGYCNNIFYNYQTYFFLVFPLEEVRIFKSQNNYNLNYNCFNNNEVNIYDCFFYEQRMTYMTGTNIMYCNFCKQNYQSSMRTILATGPEILIIILNRGKGIQYEVKINFLEEINLASFIEMNQTGCDYRLIGVITHIGESGMGGHFISYCKDPISNQWHKYNDSIVSEVSNFQKEVIDFAMPYLLFYQKKI